jgi:hypothetical protein
MHGIGVRIGLRDLDFRHSSSTMKRTRGEIRERRWRKDWILRWS